MNADRNSNKIKNKIIVTKITPSVRADDIVSTAFNVISVRSYIGRISIPSVVKHYLQFEFFFFNI